MAAEGVHHFTDASFQNEVIDNPGVTLVDFWAEWCQPCRQLAPTIDAIATEFGDKIRVGKVDTDKNPGVATDYAIMSIPTVMVFKNGKVVDKVVGLANKERLANVVNKHLASV